ncbi:uncharacterized protein MONBRDRAFT_31290 [Monosiga brevicollis MX1]|uniref:Chloride channel protein n=1 Tax=Monosiga brevicollis TaxID=81824 RepID=A9UR28_MONBE|nr:uncharacterized protein MONBRDRAFT_31290 [Monosiga brevicollis MX1]EDQ92175.1 predicted protein [Monosiga brevicollis MX1]|eukprot:XP_001743461.1 hypothetical protein [Monosiga brevicollis MX1]
MGIMAGVLPPGFPFGDIKKSGVTEGADYQAINNSRRPELSNTYTRQTGAYAITQWIILALIAIVLACLYRGLNAAIEVISTARMQNLADNMADGHFFVAWVINFFSSLGLVMVAVLFALWAPAAISSGMPEIISYLNGAKPSDLLSPSTMLSKAIGLVFAVSSGLAIGPEGPTIHLGAMIGPRLVESLAWLFSGLPSFSRNVQLFFDDMDMRKLVVAGSAAGIAVAFRSPIGGVFFVIEEAISFFDAQLVFRTYFTCIIAYYIMAVLTDGHRLEADTFTPYEIEVECSAPYLAEDIFLFIITGVVCGAAGSLFNALNTTIFRFRKKFVGASGRNRIIEALCLVLITSLIVVFAPTAGHCTKLRQVVDHVPAQTTDSYVFDSGNLVLDDPKVCLSSTAKDLYRVLHVNRSQWPEDQDLDQVVKELQDKVKENLELRQFDCDEDEYSQLGSLFFNTGHHAVNLLFQTGTYDILEADALAGFLILYFLLAVVTAGATFPSGLVIPMLTMGGAIGRMIGIAVNTGIKEPANVQLMDPGAFAMIGAAAFWCGSGGMTATIAVIILEVTGDFQYLPALAIAVITANVVGTQLNHSLYHSLIHLKHIPFLEDVANEQLNHVTVREVMASPVLSLPALAGRQQIKEALASTHNGFPVTDKADGVDKVIGLILKRHLYTLYDALKGEHDTADLTEFMNETPAFTLEHTRFPEAFRTFRSQGLRHLVVVNDRFEALGMLTRKDFQKADHAHGAHGADDHDHSHDEESSHMHVLHPAVRHPTASSRFAAYRPPPMDDFGDEGPAPLMRNDDSTA